MPVVMVNKETQIALRAIRDINKRTNGQLVEKAVEKARGETVESLGLGEALAQAIRIAYAPFVMLAPPPTVALLNAFMAKVDWNYIVDNLLIRPELN